VSPFPAVGRAAGLAAAGTGVSTSAVHTDTPAGYGCWEHVLLTSCKLLQRWWLYRVYTTASPLPV
jgi:hypothetical protein